MPRKPSPKKAPRKAATKTRSKARKAARAVKAAEAIVAGARPAAIAEQLGLSRVQTWRVLNSEDVHQHIVTLVNSECRVLNSLFQKSLVAIDEALSAGRPETITPNGKLIMGGPDHYARLAAVARLVHVLTAGRPKPKLALDDGKRRGMQLSELEAQVEQTDR